MNLVPSPSLPLRIESVAKEFALTRPRLLRAVRVQPVFRSSGDAIGYNFGAETAVLWPHSVKRIGLGYFVAE